MMNSNRHENNRVAVVDSAAPVAQATVSTDTTTNSDSSENIASKPLGEQPKAILDNATTKIDQAQHADQDVSIKTNFYKIKSIKPTP